MDVSFNLILRQRVSNTNRVRGFKAGFLERWCFLFWEALYSFSLSITSMDKMFCSVNCFIGFSCYIDILIICSCAFSYRYVNHHQSLIPFFWGLLCEFYLLNPIKAMSSITPQFSICCLVPSVVLCLPLPFVLEQVQGFNTLCWSCFIFFVRAQTISNKSPWHSIISANHRFFSMILILSLFLYTSALASLSHVLNILGFSLLPTFNIRMDLVDSLQHKNVIGHFKLLIEFFYFSLKWLPQPCFLHMAWTCPLLAG